MTGEREIRVMATITPQYGDVVAVLMLHQDVAVKLIATLRQAAGVLGPKHPDGHLLGELAEDLLAEIQR